MTTIREKSLGGTLQLSWPNKISRFVSTSRFSLSLFSDKSIVCIIITSSLILTLSLHHLSQVRQLFLYFYLPYYFMFLHKFTFNFLSLSKTSNLSVFMLMLASPTTPYLHGTNYFVGSSQ